MTSETASPARHLRAETSLRLVGVYLLLTGGIGTAMWLLGPPTSQARFVTQAALYVATLFAGVALLLDAGGRIVATIVVVFRALRTVMAFRMLGLTSGLLISVAVYGFVLYVLWRPLSSRIFSKAYREARGGESFRPQLDAVSVLLVCVAVLQSYLVVRVWLG